MRQFIIIQAFQCIKRVFEKWNKFQVISWNHQDVLEITQKWFYWIPRQIVRYFEARIVKIWRTELILWQKLAKNKYLSTWKLWFPLNRLIITVFDVLFFLNIMSWDEDFNDHSGKSWNTILWAQISKNRKSAPGNICQEIYLEAFSCNIWIQWWNI